MSAPAFDLPEGLALLARWWVAAPRPVSLGQARLTRTNTEILASVTNYAPAPASSGMTPPRGDFDGLAFPWPRYVGRASDVLGRALELAGAVHDHGEQPPFRMVGVPAADYEHLLRMAERAPSSRAERDDEIAVLARARARLAPSPPTEGA